MKEVYEFLKECGTFYLATVDGDKPRVRPFGAVNVFEDKLYIQTGKVKAVSHQLAINPKAEICAFKDGRWIRITGELINDDNREVKTKMLEKMPVLRGMYNEDDGNMQMLYFNNAEATIYSFSEKPQHFVL